MQKAANGALGHLAELLFAGLEGSETSEKIMQRVKLLTSLAAAMIENGKIESCEKELALSAALLSAAALFAAYGPEDFSRGNFFSRLIAKTDFFLSLAGTSGLL